MTEKKTTDSARPARHTHSMLFGAPMINELRAEIMSTEAAVPTNSPTNITTEPAGASEQTKVPLFPPLVHI